MLTEILRPKTLSDVIGQKHLINEKDGLLNRMVKTKKPFSIIFYGKPGIGKSSLINCLINDLDLPSFQFNASNDNKDKLIGIINQIRLNKQGILWLEEIHRLNKDKQDILLPHLENGSLIVFSATTENPYFCINPSIRSRCHIFELKDLDEKDIYDGLKKKLPKVKINLKDDILKYIIKKGGNELRTIINCIDAINSLYDSKEVTKSIVDTFLENSVVNISSSGDDYYDTLSAFHKSMRGSDCDAAIYYLAKLIQSKDLVSISRRIIACCYEDVGLANPQLCARTYNAIKSAEMVGFPEANQILATIVLEICLSQKSNSAYSAINSAINDLKNGKNYDVPNHIKDQSYASSKLLNRCGYKYPHDYDNAWIKQEYLPTKLKGTKYYVPNKHSLHEIKLSEYWKKIKK